MADKQILEQMLEHLVNDEQQKAEELFHEYVVAKSREIYENLIEAEMKDEDDEEVDEAADDEDSEEDKVEEASEEDEDEEKMDEEFEDIAIEGDDDMDDMGGDPTDDLEADLDADMGDEDDDMEEKEPEELFQDLDAIVDELQAKFDELKGGDMGGEEDEDEMKDDFDLETVREYVEKVPAGHGAEKKGAGETAGTNTKSIVDNMKNDMGGTTANILSGRNGADAGAVGAGGKIKGSALNDQNPKEDNAGNINVPGGKAGGAFSKKEPGHGAEKKGAGEQADNKQSLFRGRR
jgi:hypothetical protein